MTIAYRKRLIVLLILGIFAGCTCAGCAKKHFENIDYEKTDEEKADTAEDAGAKNSAPEAQETADAENMEEKTEEQLLVEELGLTDTFDLQASLSRLRERGFGRFAAVKKIKKEGNWTYFTVTDTDGVLFYTDTNRHGGFAPILSQTGMDNAEYVQKTLGIENGRQILYTADMLERCGCGKIEQIKDINEIGHGYGFHFTIINTEGTKYYLTVDDDGSVAALRDENDNPVHEMKE